MQRAVVRLLASVAVAIGITVLVFVLRPAGPDVHTDIVGYPTFADFDIDELFWRYGLVAVVFPVLAIGLYAVLTRLAVGPTDPWRPLPGPVARVEEIPPVEGWRTWAVEAGRWLFVGAVVGLEIAVLLGGGWVVAAATSIVYSAGVFAVAWLVTRADRGDGLAVARALTALTTPFLVAGLWGLSRSTEVEVTSSGALHRYAWLPGWIAVPAAAGLLAVLVYALRQRGLRAAASLERLAVVLVAAPVGLFLLLADLPGELGVFDSFEEGQGLAGAQLVRDGAFPWRDLMVTHGPLYDIGRGLLGFALFDDSRWGLVAGDHVLLIPLAWIAVYYLCAYLFWTNWLYLLGTQLLVVTGVVTALETRFLLVPIILLLLAALLAEPSVTRAVAFTAVLFLHAVVTPEALIVGVAALVTLAAFEFSYSRRGRAVAVRYRRVALCLVAAAGFTLVWVLFLAAFGALDDWWFALASVVPGHRLTGGIPLLVERTEFEVVAPVVAVLVAYAFVSARIRLRRAFAYQDWLLVAMALLTLLYYTKFLSRADSAHLRQSYAASVPLLFYLAFRAITYCESRLSTLGQRRGWQWLPRRHTLTAPVVVVLLVAAAQKPLYEVVADAPGRLTATVAQEPEVRGIGYARTGENDIAALDALDRALDRLLEPGDTVFDFSNAPGVLHFLLDLPPSTRYYHVSFAIRGRAQADLVRRLTSRPADAVVIGTQRMFMNLPEWDGVVNQVRHYDVSQHLLQEYVPVSAVPGFVLMVPRARGRAANPDLYFRSLPCFWGHVPSFFSEEPSADADSLPLRIRRLPDERRLVLTLPASAAEYGWLEVRARAPLAEGRFQLTDRLGADARRSIAFKTSGRGERSVRVKVGACSQWRGYRPGAVYLTSNDAQAIDSVRLIR
jgi:hypothetical protein